ncbi:MAG: antibiotic biosynthesis monooxygenase [Methanomicrobiales archaeon]|nr:antibiotic biosynthesis monooxygenase [Methanomicrobiales archaeon]
MSTWRMKEGQQKTFFDVQKKIADPIARAARGYRGAFNLIARDDPDTIVVISLWEDEAALSSSYQEIFGAATSDLEKNLAEPPEVKNFWVQSGEFIIQPRAR